MYYGIPNGNHIENPGELLPLFSIAKRMHPHDGFTVYISRRSLKHFVERRKDDFKKETMTRIYTIVENIENTVLNFESFEENDLGKFFYIQKYASNNKYFIRILLETKDRRLEIISMHLRKKI